MEALLSLPSSISFQQRRESAVFFGSKRQREEEGRSYQQTKSGRTEGCASFFLM